MQIVRINIQLSITLIARNFSRRQTLGMDRDCVDRAGGAGAASLSVSSLIDARAPVAMASSASLRPPTLYCPSASFNQ